MSNLPTAARTWEEEDDPAADTDHLAATVAWLGETLERAGALPLPTRPAAPPEFPTAAETFAEINQYATALYPKSRDCSVGGWPEARQALRLKRTQAAYRRLLAAYATLRAELAQEIEDHAITTAELRSTGYFGGMNRGDV